MAKDVTRGLDWPGKDGSPVPRTNHLLVIGIDAYEHHRKLNNARRDAEAFRDLMLRRYQFDPEHVYGLFDQDATRRNIIAALEALEQRLTEQDNLLIYFSGHGTMNRRQTQGFWIPVDAKNDGTADYLANTRVRDILADMQAHHLYLIVDACFAGSMIVRKSETAHFDLSEASPSRRVLSSGRQEVVSDGKPGEHSPFFNCLQHQLSQPLPEPLTAKSLELYVSQNTPRTAEQQPVAEFIYGMGDQSGQFVFHPKRDVKAEFAAAKAANTAAALEMFLQAHPDSSYQAEVQTLLAERKDEEAWQTAQQANSIAAYRGYRQKFSQGKYRSEALDRIEQLETDRAWLQAQRQHTIAGYERFIDRYPRSDQVAAANQAIERILGSEQEPKAPPPPKVEPEPLPDTSTSTPVPSSEKKPAKPKVKPVAKPSVDFHYPEMVRVEGGTFVMGEGKHWLWGAFDSATKHPVTLDSFEIGQYPVTQREWRAIMGKNPSRFKGKDRPVENVSWDDCQIFIRKLNEKTGLNFRLPTEAEWEYAAGGGAQNRTRWAGTDASSELVDYAWYDKNSGSQTLPVGQKKPNPLGLYDLSGNVWEWCQDWYDSYPKEPQKNPTGPATGERRVLRGGSWYYGASVCRVAYRGSFHPDVRYDSRGLRLSRTP